MTTLAGRLEKGVCDLCPLGCFLAITLPAFRARVLGLAVLADRMAAQPASCHRILHPSRHSRTGAECLLCQQPGVFRRNLARGRARQPHSGVHVHHRYDRGLHSWRSRSVALDFLKADDFMAAAPFTFLMASLIILIFGPGRFALDYLIGRYWLQRDN